jgi:predicted dehydrogenase
MVKLGLIGVGYLGKIHLNLLSKMEGIEFIGFFDSDVKNSDELNIQYGTTRFNTAKELIDKCDALVIAAPTSVHFDYAKACIESNKHVFVEKPVTADTSEAASLIPLLYSHPVCFQVGMVERFNPAFVAIESKLNGIRKIFCNRLAPFTPRGADVSVVFDVMIHDIDIVLSVAKSPVKKIQSFGQKLISETFDLATAEVEFENGMVAHFTASRMAERKYRLAEFINGGAIYKVDFLNKTADSFSLGSNTKHSLEEAYLRGEKRDLEQSSIPVLEANAIGNELKSFVDSIMNTKKVVVSLEDGVRAMQLAKEIEDQMNNQN